IFFQNSACSKEADSGSASSSMPTESSPPLVAATISGLFSPASPRFMVSVYIDHRNKFSNRVPIVLRMPEGPEKPSESIPLDGEDLETEHWEDARHWMSIYDDLIRFKQGLLDRVQRELPKMHPVAQKAADVDVGFIETQMAGYYDRLDLWYQRVWKLQGLWLDEAYVYV